MWEVIVWSVNSKQSFILWMVLMSHFFPNSVPKNSLSTLECVFNVSHIFNAATSSLSLCLCVFGETGVRLGINLPYESFDLNLFHLKVGVSWWPLIVMGTYIILFLLMQWKIVFVKHTQSCFWPLYAAPFDNSINKPHEEQLIIIS